MRPGAVHDGHELSARCINLAERGKIDPYTVGVRAQYDSAPASVELTNPWAGEIPFQLHHQRAIGRLCRDPEHRPTTCRDCRVHRSDLRAASSDVLLSATIVPIGTELGIGR